MARKVNKPQFDNLKDAMRFYGMTQERLADAVGCDRSYINKLCKGMKITSLRIPLRICRAMNVRIEALADQDAA